MNKLSSKFGILDVMRGLLDRTCPMLVDAQCIQILTEKVCVCQLHIPVVDGKNIAVLVTCSCVGLSVIHL